jgi:hypothetical protein
MLLSNLPHRQAVNEERTRLLGEGLWIESPLPERQDDARFRKLAPRHSNSSFKIESHPEFATASARYLCQPLWASIHGSCG